MKSVCRFKTLPRVSTCDSLPQLLQIADRFLFPAVLQFEVGSFSHQSQVRRRSGLWGERSRGNRFAALKWTK